MENKDKRKDSIIRKENRIVAGDSTTSVKDKICRQHAQHPASQYPSSQIIIIHSPFSILHYEQICFQVKILLQKKTIFLTKALHPFYHFGVYQRLRHCLHHKGSAGHVAHNERQLRAEYVHAPYHGPVDHHRKPSFRGHRAAHDEPLTAARRPPHVSHTDTRYALFRHVYRHIHVVAVVASARGYPMQLLSMLAGCVILACGITLEVKPTWQWWRASSSSGCWQGA